MRISDWSSDVCSSDLLLAPRWLIPIEPEGVVLEGHALVADGGRIVAVLPLSEARLRYQPRQTIELPQHALLPGFVNLHTHAAMSLLRGIADDLPLMDWLQNHIWPAEVAPVGAAFCEDRSEEHTSEIQSLQRH